MVSHIIVASWAWACAVAQPLAPARLPVQLPDAMQHDLLARMRAKWLPTLAPSGLPASTEAGGAELRNEDAFFELRDASQQLAHEDFCGVGVRRGQVSPAVGGDYPDAEVAELAEDDLGHEQVAGKTISALD